MLSMIFCQPNFSGALVRLNGIQIDQEHCMSQMRIKELCREFKVRDPRRSERGETRVIRASNGFVEVHQNRMSFIPVPSSLLRVVRKMRRNKFEGAMLIINCPSHHCRFFMEILIGRSKGRSGMTLRLDIHRASTCVVRNRPPGR